MFHIYNHANGDELLFRKDDNYLYFLKKFAEYLESVLETFAYCLMPNHFHFLIRIRGERLLRIYFAEKLEKAKKDLQGFRNLEGLKLNLEGLVAQQFSNFFNCYAKAYNKMYNRKGSLFMQTVKRKLVEDDRYYTNLVHYIHANPVQHGFVDKMSQWKYSSYNAYFFDKPTRLAKNEALGWFGGIKAFQTFHQQPLDRVITNLQNLQGLGDLEGF